MAELGLQATQVDSVRCLRSAQPPSTASQYLTVFCFNQQLFLARWGKPRSSKIGNPESLLSSDSCQELHSSRGGEHEERTTLLLSASLPGMAATGHTVLSSQSCCLYQSGRNVVGKKREIMRRCTECWAARLSLNRWGVPAWGRQSL